MGKEGMQGVQRPSVENRKHSDIWASSAFRKQGSCSNFPDLHVVVKQMRLLEKGDEGQARGHSLLMERKCLNAQL